MKYTWQEIQKITNDYKREKFLDVIDSYDAEYVYKIDKESFTHLKKTLNNYYTECLKNEFCISSIEFDDMKGEYFFILSSNGYEVYCYKDQIKKLTKLYKAKRV